MDPIEALTLLQKMPGFERWECYHRTQFECFRPTNESGGMEKVIVTILDSGTVQRGGRYHVSAKSESGKVASGNPDDSLHAALAMVHWGDLGRP